MAPTIDPQKNDHDHYYKDLKNRPLIFGSPHVPHRAVVLYKMILVLIWAYALFPKSQTLKPQAGPTVDGMYPACLYIHMYIYIYIHCDTTFRGFGIQGHARFRSSTVATWRPAPCSTCSTACTPPSGASRPRSSTTPSSRRELLGG